MIENVKKEMGRILLDEYVVSIASTTEHVESLSFQSLEVPASYCFVYMCVMPPKRNHLVKFLPMQGLSWEL